MIRSLFSRRWSRQFISVGHFGRIAFFVVPLCVLAVGMPRALAVSPELDVSRDAHAARKGPPSVRTEKIIADGQALSTQLTPGSYRFRIAADGGGAWNEAGTFAEFSIAPAYRQRTWFRALGVAVFLVSMGALYLMHVRHRAARFDVTDKARVSERIRIARELHDNLLQGFQGFLLRIQAAQSLLPTRRAEAERMLESAIAEASQAIAEARSAGQELRSAAVETDDLGKAIRALAQELASDDRARLSTTSLAINVGGSPRPLQPLVRDEIFRIGGEALRNALRGEARRIEVDLRYGVRWFELRVRHNGKGIDSRLLRKESLPGHYGLREIRERSKVVGARLDIWSARKLGTELDLGVPAATAYTTIGSACSSWRPGSFSARRDSEYRGPRSGCH